MQNQALRSRSKISTARGRAFDRIAIPFALAGIADLLLKRAVIAHFAPDERRSLIPGVLALEFVRNTHGAMGLFGSHPALLVALALVVIALLALLLRGPLRDSAVTQVGFGLVAGGAIGNVVDRVVHGYVIDYVALPRFYVFNFADACITCGLFLIALPAVRARGI
jgi:signal peptidase II